MNINERLSNIDYTIDPTLTVEAKPKLIPIDIINVNWTGGYPNLCSGHWVFKVNGNYLPSECDKYGKPIDKYEYGHWMTEHLGISGTYSAWEFGDNYEEHWNNYHDGITEQDFLLSDKFKKIVELLELNGFTLTEESTKLLILGIEQRDWRSGSCGGCI